MIEWNPYDEPAPRPGLPEITIEGVTIRKGDRVRIQPAPGGDVMDIALAGKTAVVVGIERDFENRIHVAVTIDDDPGRDLGEQGKPGHRFFFSADELEPMPSPTGA